MQFLDPLEIDDGHYADDEIGVPGDVHLRSHHGAVQAFIEKQVGSLGNLLPWSEGTGLLPVRARFLLVVQVAANLAAARFPVAAKQLLQLLEQVVGGAEMTEMLIAARPASAIFSFISSRS